MSLRPQFLLHRTRNLFLLIIGVVVFLADFVFLGARLRGNIKDVAQQLVGLLVEQAVPARMRAQLYVVGHPPVPEQPRRLAEVIEFPAPRAASRPLRARRHVSGT